MNIQEGDYVEQEVGWGDPVTIYGEVKLVQASHLNDKSLNLLGAYLIVEDMLMVVTELNRVFSLSPHAKKITKERYLQLMLER